MIQEVMEIKSPTASMRLYSPPTFDEWFVSHSYEWRQKHRSDIKDLNNFELLSIYQKMVVRNLKWQGTLIKTFMQNCNGKKAK